jgi:hypothetical protein
MFGVSSKRTATEKTTGNTVSFFISISFFGVLCVSFSVAVLWIMTPRQTITGLLCFGERSA